MDPSNPSPNLTPLQATALRRKILEAEVISRAWSDPDFLAKLEADPRAALAQAGIEPPAGTVITVTKEAPTTLKLVLPSAPKPSEEVEDAELASVSGGGQAGGGKCNLYDQIEIEKEHGNTFTQGLLSFCAGATALVGHSWGWN